MPVSENSGWLVSHVDGGAGELHDRSSTGRFVEVMHVVRPALVLGSTQAAELIDPAGAERQGVEIVRRRSGGGAVLLVPGESLWVDVGIPPNDALWQEDVGRAFYWVGELWQSVFAELGLHPEMHTGPLVRSEWSSLVCFAGLGPGELTVDGQKLLGLSQRRGRFGARFQCIVHRRWNPTPLLESLLLADSDRSLATKALFNRAYEFDQEGFVGLVQRFLAHLPG